MYGTISTSKALSPPGSMGGGEVKLSTLTENNSNKLLSVSNQLLYFGMLICAPFDNSVYVEEQKCTNMKIKKEKTQINEFHEQWQLLAHVSRKITCTHTHTHTHAHTENVIMWRMF
jgi:hypothetical protein